MRVPILIKIMLKLLKQVYCDPKMSMTEARWAIISNEAAFKGDARASADCIGIGCWQASVEPHSASWFSAEQDRFNDPWAYSSGGSFRMIARLELFTTWLCVMLLPIGDKKIGRRVTLTGETDNRGNHFAVSRCSTTKALLSFITMELDIQCQLKGFDLHLAWIPRTSRQTKYQMASHTSSRRRTKSNAT